MNLTSTMLRRNYSIRLFSTIFVVLNANIGLPSASAQDIVTPEPKIISDSDERRHWMYLYKTENLSKDPIVGTIDTSAPIATIKCIGTRDKNLSNWRKDELDGLWGKGKRVNKQTYRYKLLAVRAKEAFDTYQVDARFENDKLVAYKISGEKIAGPRWLGVQK